MCHSVFYKSRCRGGGVDLLTYEHVVPGSSRQGSLVEVPKLGEHSGKFSQ